MSERYRRYLRLRGRRNDVEREVDEEIRTHIELRTEELIRRGERPDRARAEAVRRFGDLQDARKRLRASARMREDRLKRKELLESMRRDVLFALRQARRSPGYSAVAVLTFSLGIGLTTAIVSIVDHLMLRPLPYPESEQLVALMSVDSVRTEFPFVSVGNWVDWQARNRTLSASALHMGRSFTVVRGEDATRVRGQVVVGPFFDVVGGGMLIGRPVAQEEAQERAAVVVVSERFWRANLNADRALSGGLLLDGREVQVVGVVPEGWEYPAGTDVWVVWPYAPETGGMRNNVSWYGIARLRPGVTPERARQDLSAIADGIRATDPEGVYSYGVGVQPLQQLIVGDLRRSLLLLLGGVLSVLLIACVNLAGLGLARANRRTQEVAVRLAIGAGRGRILRQVVTENLVLAFVGGAIGIGLAAWATRAVAERFASEIARAQEVTVDARVLAFAVATTVLAAMVAGAAPALKASGVPLRALMGTERTSVRGGRNLPGAALVACEVALALLLITAGGLLIRSFRAVAGRDLGFDPRGVVTAEVSLTSARYRDDPMVRLAYWNRLLERVRSLPGVEAAGVANWIPTGTGGKSFVDVEGVHEGRPGAGYRIVSDDYFRALGVPLLMGRSFEARDAPGAERVVIVNRRFVERYWPGQNPLGKRVRASSMESHVEGGAPWLSVIGVVGDLRHWGLENEVDEEIYVHHRQLPDQLWTMAAVIRGPPDRAHVLQQAVRREVKELDPLLAVDVALLEDRAGNMLRERRLTMALLNGFGSLALLLAAVGVYGLLSFAVAQRTREIGLRAALGARQAGIVRLVMWHALRVVGIGLGIGLVGAFWITRLMTSLLVDVSPTDPLTFGGAVAVLIMVAGLAALVPALRAARLDPLVAMRQS